MGAVNLYELSYAELEELLRSWGEPRYRAQQVWTWLYQKAAPSFSAMTNLPKSLRARLEAETRLPVPRVLAQQVSWDGETRKDLLELEDGEQVEVVLMHYVERNSACLSTQVGCAAGCAFCATGQMGFRRNLTAGEIVVQALHLQREMMQRGNRLTHIVLMGMGEPFLNYDATLTALCRLTDPTGFGLGQRHITVSTVGIVPGIRRFAEEDLQVNLAVSLHAATDEVRNQLMPINRRYPLDELFKAIREYLARTNRRVTLEWILIEELTDTLEQAKALAERTAGMLVHVNLIRLNPTDAFAGRAPSEERIRAFTQALEQRRVSFTLRLSRGSDIRAGCGQLRRRAQTGRTP